MPIEITTAISSTLIHPPPDAVNHNKKTPHVSSLAFSVLIIQSLFSIPALALPLSTSDSLTFSTTDQSIWGAGASPTVSADFTARLINIDTGPTSIGGIDSLSTSIPNPAYLGWKVAYDGCRKLYSSSTCINGGSINLGFTSIKIPGLGNAPPQTFTVDLGKNGLQLNSDISLQAGFKGNVSVNGGAVDVLYPTSVSLQADKSSYGMGEVITLKSFETVTATPTMSTAGFGNISTSLSAFAQFDATASVEAYIVSAGGKVDIANVHTGMMEQQLVGVSFADSSVGVSLFGSSPLTIDTSGGLGANLPSSLFGVYYPSEASPVKIPLADLQLQVPDLDTPPNSNWDGTKLTNTQLPVDRISGTNDDLTLIGSGVGFNRIDFAKIDLDVDGIISAAAISSGTPFVLGLSAGIPGILSVEGNLLDVDLGAFLSFGQTLTFDPSLMVNLLFSIPLEVEVSPGIFELVSSFVMHVGDELHFVNPGVEFSIDPTYFLDNLFTSETDFLISPVETIAALQLKLGGLAASLIGADFDAALLQQVIPLSDPIKAATLGGGPKSFKLAFEEYAGKSLFFSAASVVPSPATLPLVSLGLLALIVMRRRDARAGCPGVV